MKRTFNSAWSYTGPRLDDNSEPAKLTCHTNTEGGPKVTRDELIRGIREIGQAEFDTVVFGEKCRNLEIGRALQSKRFQIKSDMVSDTGLCVPATLLIQEVAGSLRIISVMPENGVVQMDLRHDGFAAIAIGEFKRGHEKEPK